MDETPSFYVWPDDWTEGEPLPEGFWFDVAKVLSDAGYSSETI